MQELAVPMAWPSMKSIPFEFLMVDGTEVKKQGEGGKSEGLMSLRLACAAEKPGNPFKRIGFWVDQDWVAIRKDLEQRLDYGRLRMLIADGELSIPVALLTDRMELQRCVWHGIRDFHFILYQDKIKGAEQTPLCEMMKTNPLFRLQRKTLETPSEADEAKVRTLMEKIERSFEELLIALPMEKYPKTRGYVTNFMSAGLTFLRYWLDHHEWLPFTTNGAESGFSRIVNRIKRVGRRWGDRGLANWLMLAVRKIFDPAEWESLWRQYFQLHRSLLLQAFHVDYRWIL